MIGKLAETGDCESSDPHVSVVKVTPKTGIQQIIPSNVRRNKGTISADLGEITSFSRPLLIPESVQTSNHDRQLACTLAINVSKHEDSQHALCHPLPGSVLSKELVKSASGSSGVTETFSVMSVKTDNSDICGSQTFNKTLNSSLNCQEQETNRLGGAITSYKVIRKESIKKTIDFPAEASIPTHTCDTNPIIEDYSEVSYNKPSTDKNEEKLYTPNFVFHIKQPNSTITYASKSIQHADEVSNKVLTLNNELGSIKDKTQTILHNRQLESVGSIPFEDVQIIKETGSAIHQDPVMIKGQISNINEPSATKISIKKANYINSYPESNTALNKQQETQIKTSGRCTSPNNAVSYVPNAPENPIVLNAPHALHKTKNNSQVYKVQNVLLRTTTTNANGFITKVVPSVLPTCQPYKVSSFGSPSTTSRTPTSLTKPIINVLNSPTSSKDIFKTKRNKKVPQMSFSPHISCKKRDSALGHSAPVQKYANYSTKLPNIISKIRDNLTGSNIIKGKSSRKIFLNTAEKHGEQLSVVRKYEPKYSTNNALYAHSRSRQMKHNRSTESINILNRRSLPTSVTDKDCEIDNFFIESSSPSHYSELQASASVNQEICSRTKRGIKTGQNNNIDVPSSPSLWKQVTPSNLGTTIVSENVTPITSSNTWDDEVQRFYNKVDREELSAKEYSNEIQSSPQPTILILRGDPEAVSQRTGCDEDFIGEEIRPEPTDHLPAAYHSLQLVLQDHNYGAPPPSTPMISPSTESFPSNGNAIELMSSFNSKILRQQEDEDIASVVSIESNTQPGNEEDEETETAPEEENDTPDIMDDKNSVTRCICDFQHDDGYMIQCGQCLVWQHIVCVGVTPKRIPKKYLCDYCQPRELDRYRAHALQKMIRDDLNMLTSSDSSPTRSGDKDRGFLTKKRTESGIQFPLSYSTTRNKRIRRDPSPKVKVRRQYKERKKIFRKKVQDHQVKTDMDRPSVRPWLENYELAATNHYSQELRARLSCITKKQDEKPNFILTDCTTIPFAGGRIMISTIDILPNTPLIELMGKFMLSSQHQNATAVLLGTNSRQVTQKPGPFVFFYRMPQEGTDVCIDTRTYGNEARFVRRSCKPNCELHHWFDKGTLHIYLMSIDKIESNTEITLRHEFGWHGLGIGRTPSNPCACNSPECLLLNPVQNRKTYINDNLPKASLRFGKTRSMASRSFMKAKSDSPKSDITLPDDDLDGDISVGIMNEVEHADLISSPGKSPQDSDNTSDDLRKIMAHCSDNIRDIRDESPKPSTSTSLSEDPEPKTFYPKRTLPPPVRKTRVYNKRNRIEKKHVLPVNTHQDAKPIPDSGDESYVNTQDNANKKMTREERKIAQVMKVFDRLEKDKAKKTSGAPRGRRYDSESDHARRDESTDVEHTSPVRVYRGRGKGRKKSQFSRDQKLKSKRTISEGASDDQPTIKKQLTRKPNSTDARRKIMTDDSDIDLTSSTPGTSAQKIDDPDNVPTTSKRTLRKRKIIFPKKQVVAVPEPPQGQQTEEAAGLLLALARSTPASTESGPSNEVVELPIPNMISVCQLVEAAVGPLESSLKSPKKAILNEWMNKPPQSPTSLAIAEPIATPASTPVPVQAAYPDPCDDRSSPLAMFCLAKEAVPNRNVPTSKLLDTLVQAASSICDIGSSFPESDTILMHKDKIPQAPEVPDLNEPIDCARLNETDDPLHSSLRSSDVVNIISNIHAIENQADSTLENESLKNELRTIIQTSCANSSGINDEKHIVETDHFKVAAADLGISKHQLCTGIDPNTVNEKIVQTDIAETIPESCNIESSTKGVSLDISTDLSNDSNNINLSYQTNSSGSAKKRWLHQALSEESDIPSAEVSTPLKKRRVVRESTSDLIQIGSEDNNESPIETKNFQAATTVAINDDIIEPKSLNSNNAVVADNSEKNIKINPVVPKNTDMKQINNIFPANHIIANGTANTDNAFDWEDLENHEEVNAKPSIIHSAPVISMSTNVCIPNAESPGASLDAKIDKGCTQRHHIPDEIADIHQRLQSFHSENIQVLRSRNQKPKSINEGQRKKVNLMFEVSILEDETVAVELCNEPKSTEINSDKNTSPNESVEPVHCAQIVSFDFDEFARHETSIAQSLEPLVNTETTYEENDTDSTNMESPANSPPSSVQSMSGSLLNEQDALNRGESVSIVSTKMNLEKPTSLLSFKDISSKLETGLQIPLVSPTNSSDKHEIGVAARARLDSILNATDISQDAMFDQMLKKPAVTHMPNHVTSLARNETSKPSVSTIQRLAQSKTVARTSSSDPRLQQATPTKKKLSLTEYRARKKSDGPVNSSEVYSSNDRSLGQLNVVVSDADEEPNEQENFMFTPEPTLVEQELEKHPGFLLRDLYSLPSSTINDAAIESETEDSSSDQC